MKKYLYFGKSKDFQGQDIVYWYCKRLGWSWRSVSPVNV